MRQRKSKTGNSAKRRVVGLDLRLEKRLISYALAAGAAGVSVLACSPHAEATVVFTNTWIPITPNTAITDIDLNGDGVVDFVISLQLKVRSCGEFSGNCYSQTMRVQPQGSGNAVWGAGSSASALSSGVSLGSKGKFQAGHDFMESSKHQGGRYGTPFYSSQGNWGQTINRFLGVKFIIQGEVHYGWVRMDVAATTGGMYGAISGFAYETVPNKPIKTGQKSDARKKRNKGGKDLASVGPTPEQGSLGALASGALGLQGWRQQDAPRN